MSGWRQCWGLPKLLLAASDRNLTRLQPYLSAGAADSGKHAFSVIEGDTTVLDGTTNEVSPGGSACIRGLADLKAEGPQN